MQWLEWLFKSQPVKAGARPELTGVLELRIHGVNNTSPASMLDLPQESVEPVVGDELAGFWREKDGAQDGLQEGDRGWRPEELTREAYSWGGLARNTPDVPTGGALGSIGRGLARVGWALLVPFGVANIAYWTRRLDTGQNAHPGLSRGQGAGSARLFGLGLTALPVVTACQVSMDLVATQCYRDGVALCGKLPAPFNVFAGRDAPVRLVIAATVPLALLLVFYVLSSVTRSYYERATSPAYAKHDAVGQPDQPLLATPGFWAGDRMVGRLVRLHLSLGVAIVTVAIAWPAAFGNGEACRTSLLLVDEGCRKQTFETKAGWQPLLCLGLALLVIVLTILSTVRRASDAPDVSPGSLSPQAKDLTRILLGAAILILLGTAALLAFGNPTISDDADLLGVSAAPTVVLTVLASLALSGLAWRSSRLAVLFLPLGLIVLVAAYSMVPQGSPKLIGGGCLVLLTIAILWLARRTQPSKRDREYVAWSGAGPGIMMGLALMVALTLASLITVVSGDWLNGKYTAADLIRHEHLCGKVCSPASPHLLVPAPYVLFAGCALITVLLALLLAGGVLLGTAGSAPPPADGSPTPPHSERLDDEIEADRRFASRAHRAERFLAVLVSVNLALITVVLLLVISEWPSNQLGSHGWDAGLRKVIELGTLALAAAGTAALVAMVGGKGTGSSTRPLGLLWDLVCILPRAAHPFGPPCYAERSVPELVGRCDSWLSLDPQGEGRIRRGNRIVLSAHSLGSVLAVATLFALPSDIRKPDRPPPMRLLTYGSQLRAYFGRIFPELFGPAVLGTPPVRSAQLWSEDPWSSEINDNSMPRRSPGSQSVVTNLSETGSAGIRWRNLWRRTDYLGFPVKSYRRNDIDRPAEEIDETGYLIEVVSHSDYPRALTYDRALGELVPPDEPDI